MIIEAQQRFILPYAGSADRAVQFIQDPSKTLAYLDFLNHLKVEGNDVYGELKVMLAVMGQIDLPFHSRLSTQLASTQLASTQLASTQLASTALLNSNLLGASLTGQPIENQRAWVEVGGQAQLFAGPPNEMQPEIPLEIPLEFDFQFKAHIELPSADGWGSNAFEKMVNAAAGRTLERMVQELPAGIARAIAADLRRGAVNRAK